MIINIRGTSGAGKSTLVRRLMDCCETRSPVHVDHRKQPLFYHLTGPVPPLMVLGHYETACGGCDTIKTVDQVYKLVHRGVEQGYNVLFEGIMVQDDVRRFVELSSEGGNTCRVVRLTTPVEACLRAVRERREARGDTRPFSEKNTRERARRLDGIARRLRAGGAVVLELDRDEAFRACRTLLGC